MTETTVGTDITDEDSQEDSLNGAFQTREELALRRHLQGLTVLVNADQAGDGSGKTRIVPVYFRLPEDEVRRKSYPYITIDFLGADRDQQREHRGQVYFRPGDGDTYTPSGLPAGGGRNDYPIPMLLRYQITTFARFNSHDRRINQQLMFDQLFPRTVGIVMGASTPGSRAGGDVITSDNTIRALTVESGPTNGDTEDEAHERLFRKMYTVTISSELFQNDFDALHLVETVELRLANRSGYQSV